MEFYPDGTQISENPTQEEIYRYWDWWYARASEEQQEILEAMYDLGAMQEWQKQAKNYQKAQLVPEAMKIWMSTYPWEVKDYFNYVAEAKRTLANSKGFSTDKAKSMMLVGSVPQRVKHMVGLVDRDLLTVDPMRKTSEFQRMFFNAFEHLRVGGRI